LNVGASCCSLASQGSKFAEVAKEGAVSSDGPKKADDGAKKSVKVK
jgi:hypothetical protein